MTGLTAALFLARFVHLATVLFLFGALAFGHYAGSAAVARQALRPVQLRLACGLALLSALLWFGCVAVNLGDGYDALLDGDTLRTVLLDTAFGHAWALQSVLLLLLGLLLTLRPQAEYSTVALLAAGLAVVTQAANGHPFAAASSPWEQSAHSVHLLAAALWLGGLLPLLGALQAADSEPSVVDVVRRFSWLALPAVLLLALTGLINLHTLGLLNAPWQWSGYAWILRGKLALFGVLLLLASANRFLLTPQIERQAQRQRQGSQALNLLRWTVKIEIGVGLAVLALVSALGMVAPG
jgi:putative copper resistance protein D